MPTATHDGDAVFSQAIQIASAAERDAYIAQACGGDAALRQQIEERVAAHLQASNGTAKPAQAAAHNSHPGKSDLKHGHAAPSPSHEEPSMKKIEEGSEQAKRSRLLVFVAVLVLAVIGGGIVLAWWALRAGNEAQLAMNEARLERERVQKNEEESKHQTEQAESARKTLADERDQAVADEKTVKESLEDMKMVVSFFQRSVMSADHHLGWSGAQGKEVTLRKAVDTAEPRIAETFADRPLAEATIREMFGASYLDLQAPEQAIKEYERALMLRDASQGNDHPDTVACRNQLAVAYRLANRSDQANRLFDPEQNAAFFAAALATRGTILLSQKKPAEAEKKLRECLTIRTNQKPDDWSTFDAKALLGEALADQKKYAEAEPLLLSGCEGLKQREAKTPAQDKFRLLRHLGRLVKLYEDWGKQDKANQWQLEIAKMTKKP